MLEPQNPENQYPKKILEMNFPPEDLDFFRKKGFSLEQLEILIPFVWAVKPTATEREQYLSHVENQEPVFKRGRFTLDKLRELSALYNPEQIVELKDEGYNPREMIGFSGRLSYSQILNLKRSLHKDNQQILAMSHFGLNVLDLTDLILWGLPDFQREGLERIDLKSKDLYEIRKKGLKENELLDFVNNKPLSIVFSRQPKVNGLLRKGVNKDSLGNLDFEFLFRRGDSILVFSNIRPPTSPLDFKDAGKKPPLYLCRGFFGYYVLPQRKSLNYQQYTSNGSVEHITKFRELEAFLKS